MEGGVYDVVVLGGGSTGVAAAVKAAQLGAKVAVVNAGRLGGTCVNVGCVPSKFLIRAAALKKMAERPYFRGIKAVVELDGGALMSHMREVVERLRREKYEEVLAYYDVDVIEGFGVLKSATEVEVGGRVVRGRRIIVATGSRPKIPEVPGLEEACRRGLAFTNEEFFKLDHVPSSVVFIGGGAVAVELAQALARLGARTWIIYRSALLKYEERIASEFVEGLLREEGVGLVKGEITSVEVKNGGVEVRHPGGSIAAEAVFVAAGRVPNVEPVKGLLKLGPHGGVEVNEKMETSLPGVYAAGDVTGGLWGVRFLENAAARQGVVAAINAMGGNAKFNPLAVPRVVFTDPPVASVGLREEEMISRGIGCRCRWAPMDAAAAAWTKGVLNGFIKINTYPETWKVAVKRGRIAGAVAAAPEAEEVINLFALAIQIGLTVDDLAELVPSFPSIGEAARLAALAFYTDPTKLSCCGG
jgi:mercuric reductase